MANQFVASLVIKGSEDGVRQSVGSARTELESLRSSARGVNDNLVAFSASQRAAAVGAQQHTAATRLQSHEVANLSYQLTDMGVMLASGQSPFMMMVQQGSQVGQIMGRRGLGQILPALGAGLMSLLSPTNLVLAAMVGIGYAGHAAFRAIYPEVEALSDVLKRQADLVDRLKKSYADAADQSKALTRESPLVLLAELDAVRRDAEKALEAEFDRLTKSVPDNTDFMGNKITGPIANANAGIYAAMFSDPIDQALIRLRDAGEDATDKFTKFRGEMAAISQDKSLERSIRDKALEFMRMADEAAKAEKQAKAALSPGDRSLGLKAERDMGAYSLYMSQQAVALQRAREAANAQMLGLSARSPEEKAAAARAQAAAQYNGDESAAVRALRIELAGMQALARAQKELAEAQRERVRALSETADSAKLDLALIGQSAYAVARLRFEYEQTAAVRKAAAAAGVEVDQAELALIRQKADELARYKVLAEARTFIQSKDEELAKLRLEQQLIGASAEVRAKSMAAYEAETEIRKRGIDVQGEEAKRIRENAAALAGVTQELDRQKEAWGKVQSSAEGALDLIIDGDFEGALKEVSKTLLEIGVKNPLKNALLGTNYGTLADLGGFGGLISKLLGGANDNAGTAVSSALSSTAVGSMMVNAGTVMVNGGVGGIGGSLSGLLSGLTGGFKETTTLTDLINGVGQSIGSGTGTGSMSNYREAIKAIESLGSGGYSALGPLTAKGDRALGAYQVMTSNLKQWTQEALGKVLTPQQFLNNPAAQDSVFDHFFGKSLTKYGNPQDAASVWFTGRPMSSGANAQDILGTSGAKYVEKFNTALDKITGTAGSTNNALGSMSNGLQNMGTGLDKFGQDLANAGTSGGSGGGGIGGFFSKLFGSLFGVSSPAISSVIAAGGGGLFADGGWTGFGNKYDAKGTVHANEYVFNARATQRIGVSNLERMHRAANLPGYAEGGYVSKFDSRRDHDSGAYQNIPTIVFENHGTPQRVKEEREEDDGKGGRQTRYVLEDAMADGMSRPGSSVRRTMAGVYGIKGRLTER